ncbi:MAG: divalent-cation tolerance protein CutA [Thermodesulfovibrionales bacterium]
MTTEYITVFITAPTEEEASKISRTIVEERLAACVNIIRSVRSIYRWQGRIEDESEVLMIVKTKRTLFDRLQGRVKELHSYTVPEIIGLSVIEGGKEYLDWLGQETD